MLRGLLYGRQFRTGSLALPRAGRRIPILRTISIHSRLLASGRRRTAIPQCGRRALQIPLGLLLQQAQIPIPQRIGTQAGGVERGIVPDQRDLLQLLRDADEVDRVHALGAQGLEEEEALERRVRGRDAAAHEGGYARAVWTRQGRGSALVVLVVVLVVAFVVEKVRVQVVLGLSGSCDTTTCIVHGGRLVHIRFSATECRHAS